MCPVFLAGGNVSEFPAVTHQITKLANICRRDKAAGNKVVLEDVGNPFRIFFVGFLSSNRFDILRVNQNNIAGAFQNVVDILTNYGLLRKGFCVSFPLVPCSAAERNGHNNKIKTLRRKGYGYPDDDYFFLKLFDVSRKTYIRNPSSHNFYD